MSKAPRKRKLLFPLTNARLRAESACRVHVAHANVCAVMLARDVSRRHLAHYARECALAIEVSLLGAGSRFYDPRLALALSRLIDTQIKELSDTLGTIPDDVANTFRRSIIAHHVCVELMRSGSQHIAHIDDPAATQALFFQSLGQVRPLQAMCALRETHATGLGRCSTRLPEHTATPRDQFVALKQAIALLRPEQARMSPEAYLDALRDAFFLGVLPGSRV